MRKATNLLSKRRNKTLDLQEIVKRLQNLGYASVGKGPKHPERNPDVQQEIDEFLGKYPVIARDSSYVDFLELYSAAAVARPNQQLAIDIFGFSTDITLHIAHPDEPLLDDEGFYRFAEIDVEPGPDGEESIGSLYAFDVTGTRKGGIYHDTRVRSSALAPVEYKWYCETFLEWLARVVDAGGRLPMVTYESSK